MNELIAKNALQTIHSKCSGSGSNSIPLYLIISLLIFSRVLTISLDEFFCDLKNSISSNSFILSSVL